MFHVGFEKNSFAQKKTSPTFHLLRNKQRKQKQTVRQKYYVRQILKQNDKNSLQSQIIFKESLPFWLRRRPHRDLIVPYKSGANG